MKHSFWRINFYVCRSGYNLVRRDEASWLTESGWCFKKVFHTVFDVLVTKFFLYLAVLAFEGKENALLFCHNWQLFFSKQLSYLRPIFVKLTTEKRLYCQLIVAFEKKDLKIKAERRRNHWRQKKSYFRRLFGLLHGKQEISKVLYTFFVWSMKSVERVFQTIIVQWKQSSSSQ